MDNRTIVMGRMESQGLGGRRFDDPAALVGWMGCVQAQDFAMAKWGLGVRIGGSEAVIDAAFNAGAFVGQKCNRKGLYLLDRRLFLC